MKSATKELSVQAYIRQAMPDDAAAIAKLGRDTFVESFGECYSDQDLNEFLSSTYSVEMQASELADKQTHIFIAEVGGEPAGYAKLGLCKLPVIPERAPAWEFHRMYVLAKFQGLGIGRLLMNRCIETVVKLGASEVYLGVWQQNPKAQNFYKSFGFEEIACYHFVVGTQADRENVMKKELVNG